MKSWEGGAYFRFFQEEMLRQLAPIFTADDLGRLVTRGERLPWASTVVLRVTGPGQWPAQVRWVTSTRVLATAGEVPRGGELRGAIISVLARIPLSKARAVLHAIADRDPSRLATWPAPWLCGPLPPTGPTSSVVSTLRNPLVLFDVIEALRKLTDRPKRDDPAPYRAVLQAGRKLDAEGRRRAVALLRHWSEKQFASEGGDPQHELSAWSTWYAQSFPSAPPLPEGAARLGARRNTRSRNSASSSRPTPLAAAETPSGAGPSMPRLYA